MQAARRVVTTGGGCQRKARHFLPPLVSWVALDGTSGNFTGQLKQVLFRFDWVTRRAREDAGTKRMGFFGGPS